jgi:hypothetical protein
LLKPKGISTKQAWQGNLRSTRLVYQEIFFTRMLVPMTTIRWKHCPFHKEHVSCKTVLISAPDFRWLPDRAGIINYLKKYLKKKRGRAPPGK